MNAALGLAGVTLAFGASVLGGINYVVAARRRPALVRAGRVYVWLVLAGSALSVGAMERALITRDFSLAYVAEVGSSRTPALFNVAALWSSLEGSILLWGLILAVYTALVAARFRRRADDALVSWAMVVMLAVCAFFFLLMLGPANPFRTLDVVPADGPGPNPLLQNHLLMAFHPPILYLGYVGFTVPFAFAIAALVTGRVGEGWLVETRRWTLFAWGFLTVGIILGAWWAYEVTGWGGYWGWDPVENASLLPWLTGTAFIHSVMVQERRGLLRVWNLSLLCATFSLTILGTFLTRSGVINSVHAFAEGQIGPWFLSFFGVVVAVSLGLIAWRGDRLRAPGTMDSAVSREGAFLANNVLFAVFAFVVLLGTVFPLVVEALRDERLSVGRPFFDTMTMPLGLAMLTLMAIAPVLPWRKASGELLSQRLWWPAWIGAATVVTAVVLGATGWAPVAAFGLGGFAAGAAGRQLVLATRRQGVRGLLGRTNGGMIVHLGVIVIAVAFAAAQAYETSTELELRPGQSGTFDGHTVLYEGSELVTLEQVTELRARVRVDGELREPALQTFRASGASGILKPSVKPTLTRNVYVTIQQRPGADGAAVIKVLVTPLVSWLWVGGGIMALGTVLAAFPGRRRRRPTDPTSSPVPDMAPSLEQVPS